MQNSHIRNIHPAKLLVKSINILPKGRVLDIAMGGGRNSVYLARMGYAVEGIDISEEAVNSALALAEKSGVKIKTRITDLEADCRIKKNYYDVIICFNYLQRSLISQIKEGLQTGGIVVYETYTLKQAKFGRPRNPDHLLKPNELLNMFRDFHCHRYFEGILDSRKAVAGIVAEKIRM